MKRNSLLLFGILILLCTSVSIAQSGFIKIGDIQGDASDRDHKEWIVIESFNQGLEQPPLGATGTTRRRDAVVLNDLTVTKKLDKSTPKLMEYCAKGQVVPKLELDLVDSGKVYYKITLDNARISSINTVTLCEPDCEFMDIVGISYSKITWEYSEGRKGKVVGSYNGERGN